MPSTGKLYHHKMKLRHLKADTKNEEAIDYLKKRHPLYFLANKVSEEQINDLLNRLKFKIKQLAGISTTAPATASKPQFTVPPDQSKKENNQPVM